MSDACVDLISFSQISAHLGPRVCHNLTDKASALCKAMRKRLVGEAADTAGLQSSLTKRLAGSHAQNAPGSAFAKEVLTDKLKRKWATGKITSVEIQDYCAGAVAQGLPDECAAVLCLH